jgi:peptidoglycan hydrolase-like protein with peptidoglycan-binding domain
MSLAIVDTYLVPNGELKTGNRPLFIILFDSRKSNYSIYDMDNDDKYVNGKKQFRGHFYISKDGRIFKGRPINAFGEFGYDEKRKMDFNINAIGICVEGDYEMELMPTIQKNAIVLLIQHLRREHSSIRTIYSLDELVSDKSNPGVLFPLNDIVASALGVVVEPLRTAPNGMMRYAFESRTLYYDSKNPITGNDVKELQIILNLFEFQCDVNGIFDSITMDAVIRYQKSYNLIPDGVVGTETFKFMRKHSMKFYEDKNTFNRILYTIPPNYLYGNDIKHLQTRLNLLGYPCTVNSFYDDETANAVKSFQEIHALTPDGKVGPITWSKIIVENYDFIQRVLSYTVPMTYGDDVKLVQQRLTDLGFTTSASGWFDEITQQQVRNFQRVKGLKVTGIVDQLTSKALFK